MCWCFVCTPGRVARVTRYQKPVAQHRASVAQPCSRGARGCCTRPAGCDMNHFWEWQIDFYGICELPVTDLRNTVMVTLSWRAVVIVNVSPLVRLDNSPGFTGNSGVTEWAHTLFGRVGACESSGENPLCLRKWCLRPCERWSSGPLQRRRMRVVL